MATKHTVRMLALVPAARQNAVNNWIHANLDSTGGDWLDVPLSPTGNLPATHYIFNAALTVPEFNKLAAQLLGIASISLPADWDTKTRDEKFTWYRVRFPTIRAQTGIRLRVFANDGEWDNPQDELAAAGLLPILTPIVQQIVTPQSTMSEVDTQTEKIGYQIDWKYVLIRVGIIDATIIGATVLAKLLGLF